MVEPVPQADREAFARKVKAAFVLLVALSCGLVALHSGGSLEAVAAITAFGFVVGLVLLVALPSLDSTGGSRRGRR